MLTRADLLAYGAAGRAVVRALATSAMILASARSPALVGIAPDAGVDLDTVLLACLALSLAAAAAPLAAQGMVNATRRLLISGR